MSSVFLDKNIYKKEIVFFLILYTSLIISFFLGENSTGGAIGDYINQKRASQAFASEFLKTFFEYDTYGTRHSPILIIFLSLFEKIKLPDVFIRLIHLHLALFLPFIFYKCLSVKFKEIDKKILFFLSCLIFLSPTFRSLAIWPDSRLLGLILFVTSIYYFLKFEESKNFKFAIYNVIFLALSAYLSPNFSVFSIYFFTKFVLNYGILSKKIFYIITINFVLALPIFYYIFVLDVNFLLKTAAIGIDENERIIFNNLFNDILITFSIIFFYLIPFLFFKIIKIDNILNLKNILISFLIFLICIFYFDYNYLFYLISFFAILITHPLISKNYFNILLFVIIIFNNPQYTIYHKYFDPFLIIAFFTIFSFDINLKKIFYKKNYLIIFSYFLAFLIIGNLKLIYV